MLSSMVCVKGAVALLKGKNAVVTGANRGIGKAILTIFAENGANVWACVRTLTPEFCEYCRLLEAQHGVIIYETSLDLRDDTSVKAAAKAIRAEKKPIDILVNNAGIVPETQLFLMASPQEMQDVFQVNFFAPLVFTQLIARLMVRQKNGSIINMTSIAALDGEPAQMEYVASKAALAGATKKMASELGGSGIRVNAVAPGITDTDMMLSMQAELKEKMIAQTILRRLAQPREIAQVVLFLASDLSSYMTGQIIRVDGGIR